MYTLIKYVSLRESFEKTCPGVFRCRLFVGIIAIYVRNLRNVSLFLFWRMFVSKKNSAPFAEIRSIRSYTRPCSRLFSIPRARFRDTNGTPTVGARPRHLFFPFNVRQSYGKQLDHNYDDNER